MRYLYLDVRKGQKKATMDAWTLRIQDGKSIAIFARTVGFSIPHKMERLKQMLASYVRIKVDL